MADPEPDPDDRARTRAGRSRDDAKRETREALIAAGIAAFSAEGIDAPSLDSICARAGYTRGAFYVHFKDRDDFLIAVMSAALANFIDAIVASGDAAMDLEKTVATFVGAVKSGVFPMSGGVYFHQFIAACTRNESVRTRYIEVLYEAARRVTATVAAGQGAGTVRKDVSAENLALLLIAVVGGVGGFLEVKFPVGEVIDGAAADLVKLLRPA